VGELSVSVGYSTTYLWLTKARYRDMLHDCFPSAHPSVLNRHSAKYVVVINRSKFHFSRAIILAQASKKTRLDYLKHIIQSR